MSLFYVTGVSGSGKSAVLRELQARGHKAHGVDEDGFGRWIDRETGKMASFPETHDEAEIVRWRRAHKWALNAEKIRALQEQSDETDAPVFLCGVAEGDAAVWDAFSAVFALAVDARTVKQRIGGRTDHSFGKDPGELQRVLEWRKSFERNYRRFGAVIIDASRPVEAVVDELLATAEERTDR